MLALAPAPTPAIGLEEGSGHDSDKDQHVRFYFLGVMTTRASCEERRWCREAAKT